MFRRWGKQADSKEGSTVGACSVIGDVQEVGEAGR